MAPKFTRIIEPFRFMPALTAGSRLGGMGEVYRARDTRLDRSVAVKVLPAAISANADPFDVSLTASASAPRAR